MENVKENIKEQEPAATPETVPETEAQGTEPVPTEVHPVSRFFKNIMSIDETRISVLMICLVFTVLFGAYMYSVYATIDHNWVDIIEMLIFCVTGINIASTIGKSDIISKFISRK